MLKWMCDNSHTMPKKAAPSQLTDALRGVIVDSGKPLLVISNEAGVARASLIRFLRGETSIRLDVADKLAAYFGLELRTKGK